MKICPNCGSEFGDDLNFCQKDGTPLVSSAEPTDQDDPISDKTQSIDSAPPVGEETLVMPEPPDIGDATLAMDSEEIETVVRNESAQPDPMEETQGSAGGSVAPPHAGQDIPSVPDDTMFSSEDSFSATEGSEEEGEEWEEESFEDSSAWGGSEAESAGDWEDEAGESENWEEQPFAEEIAATEEPVEQERKGSGARIGLIIAGVIIVFGFLFVVAAAVAIWWYTSMCCSPVVADANTQENANINVGEDLNSPLDDNLNAGNDLNSGNVESNTGDPEANSDASSDPRNTPRDATPTPTPGATRTPIRDTRPSPTPVRTATPRPTSTPARSTPPPPSRISKGVVNGAAISLPKPAYPAAARAVNAKGQVNVAVVISETGRVISASATSGHPLLRSAAVSAARRARFRPTLLNGRPVEVSGVIVYNFQ